MYKKLLLLVLLILLTGCDRTVEPVENFVIVNQNDYFGLIDYDGNKITNLEYDFIAYCGDYYLTAKDDESGIIGPDGEVIFTSETIQFDDYFAKYSNTCDQEVLDDDTLIPVADNYSFGGYINLKGNVVIDFEYAAAYEFVDGIARVKDTNGLYGYIDTEGNTIIDFVFTDANDFDGNGFAIASKNNFYGVIDTKGNERIDFDYITKPQYTGYKNLYTFYSSIFHKWGIINGRDIQITEFLYNMPVKYSENGIALVNEGGNLKYINDNGNPINDVTYIDAESFGSENLARVQIGELYGYINAKGEMVVEAKYEFGLLYNDGIAAVKEDGVWKYIDEDGLVILETTYDDAYSFVNGYAHVRLNGLSGFITIDGTEVIEPVFYYSLGFNPFGRAIIIDEGIDPVDFNDDWYGLIDNEGNIILPLQYDYIELR